MLLPLVAFFQLLQSQPVSVYNGRSAQLHVRPPRIEADVTIDGNLDEPVWSKAALLTGFSQFSPQDGLPAVDSTEVRVWYSPTAIYFGIRAFEMHGQPNATLADRDHIDADDQIQIILGTFNDGRQATVFAVNPLGVQQDGVIVESNTQSTGGFLVQVAARDSVDRSQDFVYQSKGHLTSYGYEVEVRIPFKSLKYQSQDVQRWGLNITRKIQHSGWEDSWAPAKRAATSFLSQSGTLDDLTNLSRGLVLDLTPVVTQHTTGAQTLSAQPGLGWRYSAAQPQVGGNVRWGITNNFTLNGTVKPDFAEIESDATKIAIDPRSAISYPEKRPFFLDGLDAFSTPSGLVFTRDIVQPVVATKITGKVSNTSYAFMSAVDDHTGSRTYSPTLGGGSNPVYDIARVQRDVGQSKVGVTVTDKEDGAYANRVADVDGSVLFKKVYAVNFQGAASATTQGDSTVTAPLWSVSLNRRGRNLVFKYLVSGMDPNFTAGSGFISRPGLAHTTVDHSFIWYGPRGGFFESVTFNPMFDDLWKYPAFLHSGDGLEKKFHLSLESSMRGGWSGGVALYLESFGYDPAIFRNVFVERPRGAFKDTVAFTGGERLFNHDWLASINSPQWGMLSFNALAIRGPDDDFDEWSTADIWYVTMGALIRPNEKLRITPTLNYTDYAHPQNGTVYKSDRILRTKFEYQLMRPIFLRFVGEYRTRDELPLLDWGRTNGALLFYNPVSKAYTRSAGYRTKSFRGDWLFSYTPNPGTVFYAGYGSSAAPDTWRLDRLTETRYRTIDAFFVKFSYLFRM